MFLVLDYPFNIQNYEAENTMHHSFVSWQKERRGTHKEDFLGIS